MMCNSLILCGGTAVPEAVAMNLRSPPKDENGLW